MADPPTEDGTPFNSSGSVELLMKDDRPKGWHRLTVGAMLLAAGVFLAIVLVAGTRGPAAKTDTSAPPTCVRSQLRVAIVGGGAGLGHGASLIQVTNTSSKECSLTGYPKFTGLFASGVQRIFKDTLNGYIGGLGTNPLSKVKPPVVILRSRHGVASSMEEADANGSGAHPTCPGFTLYVVSLPHVTGGTYRFHLRMPDRYCFQPEVHPFVSGSTGSAQ